MTRVAKPDPSVLGNATQANLRERIGAHFSKTQLCLNRPFKFNANCLHVCPAVRVLGSTLGFRVSFQQHSHLVLQPCKRRPTQNAQPDAGAWHFSILHTPGSYQHLTRECCRYAAEMLESRVQNPNPDRIDQLADALHDVVPAERPEQQQQQEQQAAADCEPQEVSEVEEEDEDGDEEDDAANETK